MAHADTPVKWPFRLVFGNEEVFAARIRYDATPYAIIRVTPTPRMHRNRALVDLLNFSRDLQTRGLTTDARKRRDEGVLAYAPSKGHGQSVPLPYNPSDEKLLDVFKLPFYFARINTPHLDYILEPKDWNREWSPTNGAVYFESAQNLADPIAAITLKLTESTIPPMYVRDQLQEILEF